MTIITPADIVAELEDFEPLPSRSLRGWPPFSVSWRQWMQRREPLPDAWCGMNLQVEDPGLPPGYVIGCSLSIEEGRLKSWSNDMKTNESGVAAPLSSLATWLVHEVDITEVNDVAIGGSPFALGAFVGALPTSLDLPDSDDLRCVYATTTVILRANQLIFERDSQPNATTAGPRQTPKTGD
jgi:hypothetical protein